MAHLRVNHHDDGEYVSGLISAAAAYIESSTGLVVEAGDRFILLSALSPEVQIFIAPVRSVKIEYRPVDNPDNYVELPAQYWRLAHVRGRAVILVPRLDILPAAARSPDAYRVTVRAGPTSAQDAGLPAHPPRWMELARQAGLLLIGGWYGCRESATAPAFAPVPHGVDALLALARRGVLA